MSPITKVEIVFCAHDMIPACVRVSKYF